MSFSDDTKSLSAKGDAMSTRLSTKCRYGTRAIIEIAREWPNGSVKKRQISRSQAIPASYLENILLELKTAGLVEASRGARGGYRLTRAPESISVLDITRAFDDSCVPVECIMHPEFCPRTTNCAARRVWLRLHQAQEEALAAISVRDLLEEEK